MTASMSANLTPMLLVLLLQSTILLLLGLLALNVTHKRGPTVQSLVGRASLASVALLVLLLPLTSHVPPVVRVTIPTPAQALTLPKREGEEVGAAGVSVQGAYNAKMDVKGTERKGAASNAPIFPAALPPTPLTSRPPYQGKRALALRVSSAALGGFLSVAAALLLWLGVCQWHLTRLRRTAQAIATGPAVTLLAELTPNPPHLLSHPSVHSPFLAGYRRPAIFLPTAYETDFNADALRAIFVHELAHRDHRDNLWTLATRLLTALLWPQPLLWLLVRRLEHISEDACDEAVLAQNCPPRAYADCLLFLATCPQPGRREHALSAGVGPFRSSVGRRIHRILTTKGVPSMSPTTLRLRLTAAALTIAAALSSLFLVSSAPAQSGQRVPHNRLLQRLRQISGQPKQQEIELSQARFLAGLTSVRGPGIIATLTDSKKPFPSGIPSGMTPPNLIHDTDINQVVNELKAAGAEAIAVNGQRLVATSAIRTAGPTTFINNIPQTPPYIIRAIGNPKVLSSALNLPGGLGAMLKQFDPTMFSIQQAQLLTLPAYSGGSEPRYAKPVGAGAVGVVRSHQLAALIAQRNQLQAEYEKLAPPMLRYQRTFDDELRQALPPSEAQALARARNLEFNLGWDQADLADMKALLQRSHKSQAQQLVHKIAEEKEQVAALRAEEVSLFPATVQAQQHLAQVHALALHHPIKPMKLQFIGLEMVMLDNQIQQLTDLGDSSATAAQ